MAFPAPAGTFITVIHEGKFTLGAALGTFHAKHVFLSFPSCAFYGHVFCAIEPDYTI
jgi:hypothetical protein